MIEHHPSLLENLQVHCTTAWDFKICNYLQLPTLFNQKIEGATKNEVTSTSCRTSSLQPIEFSTPKPIQYQSTYVGSVLTSVETLLENALLEKTRRFLHFRALAQINYLIK